MNNKFAFIECRNIELTNAALSLTGIPFMGSMLKVGRPSKYAGPPTPASTWQQLTGQTAERNQMLADPTTKNFRGILLQFYF